MPIYVQVCPSAFVHVAFADAPIVTQVTLRFSRVEGGEPGIAKAMAANERIAKSILLTNMLTVSSRLFSDNGQGDNNWRNSFAKRYNV